MTNHTDRTVLEMALIGLRAEATRIDQAMAAVRKRLGVRGSAAPAGMHGTASKRVLSPQARRRIAAAQKARWAKFRAAAGKPAANTTPKRTLSPEAKAKLAANLAKARAARAAKAANA